MRERLGLQEVLSWPSLDSVAHTVAAAERSPCKRRREMFAPPSMERGWPRELTGTRDLFACANIWRAGRRPACTRVATAEHEDSLEGGVFVLEDGTRVEYGLR